MSRNANHRPLPIIVDGISNEKEARGWLELQSAEVRAVTAVVDGGKLVQRPLIEKGAFVDETAVLIGGMIIKKGCYVGPYAIVRLDEKMKPEPLILGEDSNLQDCAVVHSNTTQIGRRVIVAHQSIVHGAEIKDGVTIYIQAVVDGGGTVVEEGCFLHQGSYVGKGIQMPRGRYVAPGQKILTQKEADQLPPVPTELLTIRENVLADNRAHVMRHFEVNQLL